MLPELMGIFGTIVGGLLHGKESQSQTYYSSQGRYSSQTVDWDPSEGATHSRLQATQSLGDQGFRAQNLPREDSRSEGSQGSPTRAQNRFLRKGRSHSNVARNESLGSVQHPTPRGAAPGNLPEWTRTPSTGYPRPPGATGQAQPHIRPNPYSLPNGSFSPDPPTWATRPPEPRSFPVPLRPPMSPNPTDHSAPGPALSVAGSSPGHTPPSGLSAAVAVPKYVNGLCGLRNLGNTCYMSACIQCLLHTDPIVEYFEDGHHARVLRERRRRAPLAEALAEVIASQQRGDRKVLNPSALKGTVAARHPNFAGYQQQDAQEFLRFTLDTLHEELNRVMGTPRYEELKDVPLETDWQASARWWANHRMRNDSFLMDLFCGQLKSHVTCRRCNYLSKAFDPFMDLSLPLKGNSVVDCLTQFMEPEQLQGAERFYCPSCKAQVDSTRKLSVYRWPEVLVLHLKRFSYRGYASKKLNNDVTFNRTLDLSCFADADSKPESLHYRLYAVVHHIGGAGGGHYTAACARQSSDPGSTWYEFDDASVSPLAVPPSQGNTPYILFFTRSQPPRRS
jgi:ubiquitin C-terminal hydrolase